MGNNAAKNQHTEVPMSEPTEESASPAKGKGIKLPIKLPAMKLPAVKLPNVKLPDVKLPVIHIPKADLTILVTMILVGGLSVGSAAVAIRMMMPAQIIVQRPADEDQESSKAHNRGGFPDFTTGANVLSDFSMTMERPVIADSAFVHPQASIIGYVSLGEHVFVAPQASLRGDVGKNITIGNDSNVQDGVIIHALPTEEKGNRKMENTVLYDGQEFAVYVGQQVTMAPQCQVYGPAVVGNNAYLGMQSLVFRARIGEGSVLEPRSAVIDVSIPEGRYVPAGVTITSQEQADSLPAITAAYSYAKAGAMGVHINKQLAAGYRGLHPTGH